MPVQVTPWQDYWDALDADDPAAAGEARERCRVLGVFLLMLAVEDPGLYAVRKLREAFGAAGRGAARKAAAAAERADWAIARIDALEQRVRELERAAEGRARAR